MKTRQVLQLFTVCRVIVLAVGNAVVAITPVAAADMPVNASAPAGTISLASGWIQTNWPTSNSFFSLYTNQDKIFARIWDSLNGGRVFLTTQVDKVFNAIKNYGNPQSDWQRQEEKTGGMCGIEMACWDITGKVYNVPVWKLIGPKLRERVRLYADTGQKNSYTLPAAVQKRLNRGFTWFKADMYLSSLCTQGTDYTIASSPNSYGYRPITIYSSGYSKIEAYARAYRNLIGTYPLASDHYQGYNNFTSQLSVESAVELANRMAASDCQGMTGGWMEDIIDWGWSDGQGIPVIKQVNDQTEMPILTGEDMYCLDEYQAMVDAGAVDIIHPDEATAGGIHQTRLSAMYAHTQGVRTALHCTGSAFSYVASLHIAAGIPDFLALEYHYIDDSYDTWYDSVVDGIEKPLIGADGYAAVPEGPGLGITPNAAAMSAHGASSWTRVT